MKLQKIHLFIILLFALLLCSCLGGFLREGMTSSQNTYTGSKGNSATVTTGPDGNKAVTGPDGNTSTFNTSSNNGSNTLSNRNYNSESVSASAYTGPRGNTIVSGPNNNAAIVDDTYDNYSSDTYSGPAGNSATVVSGPGGGSAVITDTNNNVNGISYSDIPPGQQDMYILKSQIVPPVCPACPVASACPRQEACPPCPACERCPEPAFECKKVPNYASANDNYLPRPVMSDFSQFGM